jgi:hypothetical protein
MALVHRVGWDPLFVRRSAWFWPLAAAAQRLAGCEDWPARFELDAMYHACAGATGRNAPLVFADNVRRDEKHGEGPLRLERLYDGRIAVGHEVPTREQDWHDLFTALCFATYPRAKLALHRRQYAILQERVPVGATRLPATRSREQDALTLLDEGGAVLAAEPSAAAALRAAHANARNALLHDALAAGHARVVPFGHALFEHLVEGLRCPGGFTQLLELPSLALPDAQLLDIVDDQLAAVLADRSRLRSPSEGGHLRLDDLGLNAAPT